MKKRTSFQWISEDYFTDFNVTIKQQRPNGKNSVKCLKRILRFLKWYTKSNQVWRNVYYISTSKANSNTQINEMTRWRYQKLRCKQYRIYKGARGPWGRAPRKVRKYSSKCLEPKKLSKLHWYITNRDVFNKNTWHKEASLVFTSWFHNPWIGPHVSVVRGKFGTAANKLMCEI